MLDSPIAFTASEVTDYYSARVPKLKQARRGERRGPCPIHGGKDDNFAVDPETGRWFCHSTCGRGGDILELEEALAGGDFPARKAEVFRLVGRRTEPEYRYNASRANGNSAAMAPTKPAQPSGTTSGWREVDRYQYVDEAGKLRFELVRQERGEGAQREKRFLQRRPDGRGGWIWNLDGVDPLLYRLPELLNRSTETVFLVEGEKCVHSLEARGLLASCAPMGAGKWRPEYSTVLAGRNVVVLQDNDAPGRKHAAETVENLLSVAASIRVLELPGLPAKGDIADWQDAGGTLEQLLALADAAALMDAVALSELRARWGLADEEPHYQERADAGDDWPKPEPIQSELPPVQAFSEELLPESFRPLVADVTQRMQVPMDYPAVVMVLCLAGAVNRRAMIQPKERDTGWVEPANLWGAIIGPPGVMKTPVIQAITRPLVQIQTAWRQEYEEEMAEHARATEESELTKSAWKEQFKASRKSGSAVPERPPEAPEKPRLRRLIVNDATFEALHQTMSENCAGVLLLRDELTGWLAGLERSGHEPERAFCLEAWNGKNPFTMDRIGRGTIHVPACCMSLFGGIQPGRLHSYMADALCDGPTNDGLIQRISVCVWPDLDSWEYVDRAPNPVAEELTARVFRKLAEMGAENPARLRFATDAQELFVEWLTDLEAKIRRDEHHPAIIAHLSKYRKLMPVLALLFELADRASSEGFEGSSLGNSLNFVSLDHAKQAAAFCEYLESHLPRIYSGIVTPQMHAAQELARKIKALESRYGWLLLLPRCVR